MTKKREGILPEHSLPFRKALMKGVGFDEAQLRNPLVGIVNSWGENNPAARHMGELAREAKAGVLAGGGTPLEFCISSLCGGIAGGGPGARYSLGYRDVVASFIEIIAEVNYLDGLVLLPVCDDTVPAHLMAAARLDLPSILVVGGYMMPIHRNGEAICALDVSKRYAGWKKGRLSEGTYRDVEDHSCQSSGACPWMGTGNTMAAMAETLGMTLPGNSTTCGSDPKMLRFAYQSGRQVMELLKNGGRPGGILTRQAFENAVKVCSALGGSTNALLHLPAVASEAGVEFEVEWFDRMGREIPLLANIKPSGKYLLQDLDEAGGLPAVLKELGPKLDLNVKTVTGATMGENIRGAKNNNPSVIYPMSAPIRPCSGIAFLKGNLAPDGAVVKISGVAADMNVFRGPAKVFESETEATQALLAGTIVSGDAVMIRYMGPKGDPGMRVCGARFLWILSEMEEIKVALITDGRFSGTNRGLAVGHVSPEAAVGGPLALVEQGDMISIDIANRLIQAEISEREFEQRRKKWRPPAPKAEKGFLAMMERMMQPAEKGAVLKP